MYLLIRFPLGIIAEAVILAKTNNCMRVAASGFPDTLELRRSGSQWFTATGQQVEFDFLMSNAHTRESVFALMPACVAQAAGSVGSS